MTVLDLGRDQECQGAEEAAATTGSTRGRGSRRDASSRRRAYRRRAVGGGEDEVERAFCIPLAGAGLPTEAEIWAAGEAFLAEAFGPDWQPVGDALDRVVATPIDNAWVARRVEKLKVMSAGPMRLIPKALWNLSRLLMDAEDWFDHWRECAQRCPRDWLVRFTGVAVLTGDGTLRSLRTRRVQSMLAAGVLAWQLAEHKPDVYPQCTHVLLGLTRGSWRELLSYHELHVHGWELHVPSESTLYNVHERGGLWHRGQCGYFMAWRQAGIAWSHQPCGWETLQRDPGLCGKPRKNKDGDWECHAFHELWLRVDDVLHTQKPMAMGPPLPSWRYYPPEPVSESEMTELQARVDEIEQAWLEPAQVVKNAAPEPKVEPGAVTTSLVPNEIADELKKAWFPDPAPPTAAEPAAGLSDALEHIRMANDIIRKRPRQYRQMPTNSADPSEPNFRGDPHAVPFVAAASLLPEGQGREETARFLEVRRRYQEELQRKAQARGQRADVKRSAPS